MSFKGYLKQSTAATIMLGPFLDTTDGNTPEAAMTLEDTEIWLSENGAAFANPHDTNNAAVDANVTTHYTKALDDTDTGTCGILRVITKDAAALIVDDTYIVVNANVFDSLFAAATTDYLQVDVLQIGGVAQSATDLKDLADTGYDPSTHKVQGVALTDTCTSNTDMRGTDSAALASVCTEARLSELDAGTAGKMANQVDVIQTDTTTDIPALIDALPTAAEIKTAIEAAGSHLALILEDTGTTLPGTLTTIAGYLDTEIAAILADTNELQTDWVNGGRLDLLIDAVKAVTDALTAAAAAKLALSAGTIVSGAAAAGTLSTTQMTTDLTEATNDHYNGRIIIWTSGVLQNQATNITDYDGASKMLTFTAVTEAPTALDTFIIV